MAAPKALKQIEIYTDGSCMPNPGVGGWGVVLVYKGVRKERFGGDPKTTNNRMELNACIEGLISLKEPCEVWLYTDSQYVQRGMTEWLPGWIKKDFKNVKNSDLWRTLHLFAQKHKINWQWVRGHNGNDLNNRADVLADRGRIEQVKKRGGVG